MFQRCRKFSLRVHIVHSFPSYVTMLGKTPSECEVSTKNVFSCQASEEFSQNFFLFRISSLNVKSKQTLKIRKSFIRYVSSPTFVGDLPISPIFQVSDIRKAVDISYRSCRFIRMLCIVQKQKKSTKFERNSYT